MSDSLPPTGTRIEVANGYRGTVRYVGGVGSTSGSWLGVEWDDTSRGKHSGDHEGVSYFTTRDPNAGSFVRPSKCLPGIGLREAVEERYGSKAAHNEFLPEDLAEIQRGMNAALFEVVGMDKVREVQKDYMKLNVISLRNMRVQRLDGDLGKFIPNVRSLDLGENLLDSWDDVLNIIKDLHHLEHLVLSENRLSLPSNPPASLPRIKHLVLGRMNYSWYDIYSLITLFPSLKNLQVHGNAISDIQQTPEEMAAALPHLKELDMNLNPVIRWENIDKFASCPSLEAMMLNDCQLTHVGGPLRGFPLLKKLELNCNAFADWKTLRHLADLPSLSELRLKGDELINPAPKIVPKGRRLSHRQIVIAMFRRLTILNGTEIERQERFGAEIDYLKMFGLDYHQCERHDIPCYDALVSLHGPPDESELTLKGSNMDDMFIHLFLQTQNEGDPLEKKVPKTMSVKALKIFSKKLFKAPRLNDLELSYTSKKKSALSIPLDDDMREITYFGIDSGDTVIVSW